MKRKKWTGILVCVLAFGLMTGCGSGTDDAGVSSGSDSGQTTDAATEKEKISIEAQMQPEITPREVTKYVNYNGQKVELSGNTIAEDCFFGIYYCEDMDSVTLPKDAPIRKQLDYSLKTVKNEKEYQVSELPIKISFGRGFDYSSPTNTYPRSFGILTEKSVEEKYRRKWIGEEYSEDIADIVYHNYVIQRQTYMAYVQCTQSDSTSVGYPGCFLCTYTIEGDTIHFQEIEPHEDYSFKPLDFTMDFQYSFNGTELTISSGSKKVKLVTEHTHKLKYVDTYESMGFRAAATDRGQVLNEIAYFYDLTFQGEKKDVLILLDGAKAVDPEVEFREDGTFRIQWDTVEKSVDYKKQTESRPGKLEGQFIGLADNDGMILIVDGKGYAYMMPGPQFDYNTLFTEGVALDKDVKDLSDEEVTTIMDKQKEAAGRVQSALKEEQGIKLNEISGEVVFESGLLFGYDDSELGEEGKKALDGFLAKYAPVITELKKDQVIEGVRISGFTDSQGQYTYNKTLSEKRAENVKNYMIAKYPELDGVLQSEGRASESLIRNQDGTVNDEASRRVTFDLIIKGK